MPGAVYGMTNQDRSHGGNSIVAFRRDADGSLSPMQVVPTGGNGSGTHLDPTDSLGSQGALVLGVCGGQRWLFAANPNTADGGENLEHGSISSFRVAEDGTLTLVDQIDSHGLFPCSLTFHGSRLFVLNAGGADGVSPNITGFWVDDDGSLHRMPGTTRDIDPGNATANPATCGFLPNGNPAFGCGLNPPAFVRSPAQVGFTPSGDALVVTVKSTNTIYAIPLDDGDRTRPSNPGTGRGMKRDEGTGTAKHRLAKNEARMYQAPAGELPTSFGFDFDAGGHLIVCEPFGAAHLVVEGLNRIPPPSGGAESGALSSFAITAGGITPITRSVRHHSGTSCWVLTEPQQRRFAYASNNNTNDISIFAVASDGSLSFTGVNHALGDRALPNELATAHEGGNSFLYVLASGIGHVMGFRIDPATGGLSQIANISGLPEDAGAQGLVAF